MQRRRNSTGIAAIPTVVIFGGILAEIAIATAFLSFALSNTSLGIRLSAEAFSVAQSGIEDAILQLARNRNFSNTSGYTLTVGSGTATITVTQGSPAAGQATILSVAAVFNRKRAIQAVVSVDTISGVISVVTMNEVTP